MSEQEQVNDQQEQTPGEATQNPFNEFLRHQQRAVEETGKALDALLPPAFKEHSQEACREFTSGVKVLFDAALEGLQWASKEVDRNMNRERSGDDAGDRPSSTGATKVKVQVD
jgi:hypothetical protein